MSTLVLELRQGDLMVVNGAPIRFRNRARIELAARARFLFGKQIMAPEGATTPARRIYFALQTAYIGADEERSDGLRHARFLDLLKELHAQLESGTPVRDIAMDAEQRFMLSSFALLTQKPMLILVNVGDDQADQTAALEAEYGAKYRSPNTDVLVVCGKLEAELAQMEPEEAAELREGLGMDEPGRNRVIRASYALLGFQSFFTVGPDENRAWTIRKGDLAPQAAGKIHSDLEKGFIRAETVSYEHLIADGGWNEAKKAGHLRTEGRTYVVQDGDVMNILFSRG